LITRRGSLLRLNFRRAELAVLDCLWLLVDGVRQQFVNKAMCGELVHHTS